MPGLESNPYLQNLVPHSARKKVHRPVEGARLTLKLPGEIITAEVMKVVSDDGVIAKIDSVPMSRGHTYKKDDIIPCRRAVDGFMGTEHWEVVSEHELNLADSAARFEQQERAKAGISALDQVTQPEVPNTPSPASEIIPPKIDEPQAPDAQIVEPTFLVMRVDDETLGKYAAAVVQLLGMESIVNSAWGHAKPSISITKLVDSLRLAVQANVGNRIKIEIHRSEPETEWPFL